MQHFSSDMINQAQLSNLDCVESTEYKAWVLGSLLLMHVSGKLH